MLTDVKEHLEVDPRSPSGLRWIKSSGPNARVGQSAGSINGQGRWVVRCKRKHYLCHRLVIELSGRPQPSSRHEVDHINGVCTDNRDENLRWVLRSGNLCNREYPNPTGFRWVVKHLTAPTYKYSFQVKGKRIARSGFATAAEAHDAALAKREELGLPIETRLSTVHS